MSGHLARMVVRSTRAAEGGLRRRLPSMFEQPSFDPGPASVAAAGEYLRPPVAEERPRSTSPREDVAAPVVGEQPGLSAAGRSAEVLTGGYDAAPDDVTPHPAQPRTEGARPRKRRPQEAVRAEPVRPGSESPPRSAPRGEPPRPEVAGPVAARAAVHEQVVGSPTADGSSVGRRETGVVEHREDGPSSSPQPPPRADVPPVVPARHEEPRADLPNPDLPRLQPSSRGGQRSAVPDVTVNIGRIEVVRPTPEPRKPPPERPPAALRAPGAPKLADYLRERRSR